MTATPSSTTKYVGIASTTTSTAPTKSSEYKWSKYVGENGVPGENGYIHIAYADSSDGKTGFDTVNGTNKNISDNILTILRQIVKIPQITLGQKSRVMMLLSLLLK